MSTAVGGQAVIEGVMMRAGRSLAIAVRRSGGDMILKRDTLRLLSDRFPLLRKPFLRGVPAIFSSLVLGIRALNFSASLAMEEEGEESAAWPLVLSTALALGLGVGLFFYLPLLLAMGLSLLAPSLGEGLLFNIADGLFRLVIFLVYLYLISLWGEIRRVFEYHGAEHMAVSAYEDGKELSIETVRAYDTVHPRCGTSFLLAVMVVSIMVFTFIPPAWPFWAKFLSRIVLLPLIAGISYEVIRLGGRIGGGGWGRVLNAPGRWLQKMTTRDPDDAQIEVALEALKAVVAMEGGGTPA
jgi:uncharacterized protein YqhQ